jgi:hypothetical protein
MDRARAVWDSSRQPYYSSTVRNLYIYMLKTSPKAGRVRGNGPSGTRHQALPGIRCTSRIGRRKITWWN